MTTLTATPDLPTTTPARPGRQPRSGVRLSRRGVLRSEWVKFRSLRSNVTILAAAGGVLVLVGLIVSGFVGGLFSNAEEAGEFAGNPAGASLQGILLAQLIIGVLGTLAITSEYATRTIRTSLTMVPGRLPVLWAKAAVIAVVTFATMLVSALAVFFAGQAIIAGGDVASASLTDPGVLRAVVGTAAYLTAVALIGLAVGTLLRSTAGAISTLVGVLFLLPGLGQLLLPAGWRDDVLQFLPSNAGSAFTEVQSRPELLSPTAGALVVLAWVVIPLVAAAIAYKRRPV